MRLPSFDYYAPDSLKEVLKIKGELGASASVLAGGTDLVVQMKHRLVSPRIVISLKNIQEIKGIEEKPDAVTVAAGTSLDQMVENEAIQRHFPILNKAVESIGAIAIQRYKGTIGGNICLTPRCNLYNQSFFWRTGKGSCHRTGGKECHALEGSESCQAVCSGDTSPVLVALSAQATLASATGTRMIPLTEFYTGKGESPFNLMPEEIITEIRLPLPWAPISWSYQRLAMRSAVDYPIINAACVAIMDKGKVESFRLVLAAAGPAPVILKEAEQLIKGSEPDTEMITKAAEIAVKAVEGIIVDNMAASKDYRIKMAGTMAGRAVKEALGL
jgi:4-hydroxybenzoyl-CoA reductase subunit beta